MASEEIDALNQILGMIDEKATLFKDQAFDMPVVKRSAQKKLLLDLIGDAMNLCKRVSPEPLDVIVDLKKLTSHLDRY